MHRSFAYITLCSLCLSYGCAPVPATSNVAASRPLQQQVQTQQRQIEALNEVVARLETRLNDNQQTLNTIQKTLDQLKNQPGQPQVASAVVDTVDPSSAQGPSATEIYRQAFAAYTQGQYAEAERGFGEFLRLYPQNPFAATAYYRLAEAQQAQGKTQLALSNFATVASTYPEAHKAPDALYNMAVLLKNGNQLQHAQAVLNRLQQDYPDSDAARNARGGLASLGE